MNDSFNRFPPVKIIGLIGGVASGKSWVAREFQRLGAKVLDADRAGHEVLKEPSVMQALRNRWGNAVFNPLGAVNRAAVARIVFAPPPAGPPELTFLEQITHPLIGERLRTEAATYALEPGSQVAILDAPVLLKAGWDKLCDRILFVDAPFEVRLARALQRGWTRAEFAAREAAQEPLAEKRGQADLILDNSGSPEESRSKIAALWPSMTG